MAGIRILGGVFLAMAAMCVGAGTASAVDVPTTLSVNPFSQVVDKTSAKGHTPLAPGDSTTRGIWVYNNGDAPVTVHTSIANVVATTDGTSLARIDYGDEPSGTATWLGKLPERLTIPPHGSKNVTVEITVPKDATGGSHVCAVAFTQTPGQGPSVRLVSALVVSVRGAVERGRIEDAQMLADGHKPGWLHIGAPPTLSVSFTYRSTGSALLEPKGSAKVGGIPGGPRSLPIRLAVYPGGTADWHAQDLQLPSWGIARPQVVLTSDAGRQVETFGTIVIVPVWLAVALPVGLLALATGGVWLMRRRRRRRSGEVAAAGEGS